MSPTKLPPPAPPPTVPIPPAPSPLHEHQLSTSSSLLSPIGGDTPLDSPTTPATSLASSGRHTPTGPPPEKLAAQIAQQARHIEEQDTMIKTLNKQLTHCETDLQAHIDLVASLESSLGDAEKNREYSLPAPALLFSRGANSVMMTDR